jgi:hypothetical protein
MTGHESLKITWRYIAAAGIYIIFAVYLFKPYLSSSKDWQYLWLVSIWLASIGCFILSRRWIAGFAGSFFAGVIYGFGPYMLGLIGFNPHPVAGLLVAVMPLLFYPAVFGVKDKWKWFSFIFAAIPFLAIALFFYAAAAIRLFPISIQARLNSSDLYCLLTPLVAAKLGTTTLIGFYHIPLAALIMGLFMLFAARRYSIMIIIISGIILTFCDSFNSRFGISPLIWLSIPTLCFSVIIGVGFQGLSSSGFADRKWILSAAIVLGVLAIVTLLFATEYFQVFLSLADGYARLFVETAKMYLLGAVVLTSCFFMTSGKLQLHHVREIMISIVMGLDILISAAFTIDKLL